jgi:hypothetical protein
VRLKPVGFPQNHFAHPKRWRMFEQMAVDGH